MHNFPPNDETEFAPVVGDLTKEELDLFEQRLQEELPDVRYLTFQDKGFFPTIQRFSLAIHQEDRSRATAVIDEVMRLISPTLHRKRTVRRERELAALVRQYVRAKEADDPPAMNLMVSELCHSLNWFLGEIIHERENREIDWDEIVGLGLDPIVARDVTVLPPFGLKVVGSIHFERRSDPSQEQGPFMAEIRTSDKAATLDRFVARCGTPDRLATNKLVDEGLPRTVLCGEGTYRITLGQAITASTPEDTSWAFEFAKIEAGNPAVGIPKPARTGD